MSPVQAPPDVLALAERLVDRAIRIGDRARFIQGSLLVLETRADQ